MPSRPSGGGSSSGHLSVSSGTAGAPGARDAAPAAAAENLCLFCRTSGKSGREMAGERRWRRAVTRAHAIRVRCDSATSRRCGDSHVTLCQVRSAAGDAKGRGCNFPKKIRA